ncbi:inositol monophosphatase family protein [Micromonospora sp. WMMD712]|uniref:inositol monophosphatase family protein n=1 Tax=Micromonospora sp. WMMD712 TaxID=3016096 RepID=UPI00249C8D4A|nr:inositol monophosphatase family protein [Micromonospora sp. WMMD712]WFE60221.1 inositol monophosphatase family protein [Micromonospora sp. WMMD712]
MGRGNETPDRYDCQRLARAAVHAGIEAGNFLRHQFRRQVDVRTKDGVGDPEAHVRDVVSECDLRAEDMIRQRLQDVAPGSRIIGEEHGSYGDGDLCWYVDPIDGTYNFVRGLPLFCVSIGFSVAGVPRGGCVYDPSHEELFVAVDGRLSVNGRPWRSPRPVPATSPLVLTDIPHGNRPHPADRDLLLRLSRHAEVRRLGSSALALAWLAVGRADAAANTDIFAWDVAAGRCLVEAAGGRFVMMPDPTGTAWRGSFVAWTAAGAQVGPRLLQAVAAAGPPVPTP